MIKAVTIDVLTDEVTKLLKFLENLPANVMPALLEAMDEGTQVVLGKAQRERFRGKGPFPVSQRKLGVVTGMLRKSLFASQPRVSGPAEVETRVGSNVKYFGGHEFGFAGVVQVPQHSRRRGGVVGRVVTKSEQAAGGGLKSTVKAHSRRMKVPKRAPLGAAFDDHSQRTYEVVFAEKFGQLLDAMDE